MATSDVIAGGFEGKDNKPLRDFLGLVIDPMGQFLSLLDHLGGCNDDVAAIAATGAALLRQVDEVFDELHEKMRVAGIDLRVSVKGESWAPTGVESCRVNAQEVHHA